MSLTLTLRDVTDVINATSPTSLSSLSPITRCHCTKHFYQRMCTLFLTLPASVLSALLQILPDYIPVIACTAIDNVYSTCLKSGHKLASANQERMQPMFTKKRSFITLLPMQIFVFLFVFEFFVFVFVFVFVLMFTQKGPFTMLFAQSSKIKLKKLITDTTQNSLYP